MSGSSSLEEGGGMRGLLVGGVASGCGKTTVTLGLMAALRRRGLRVQGFKVGPDYIDPGLHACVTGRPSWNLDGWMCGEAVVRRTFLCAMRGQGGMEGDEEPADIGIVEGVMGLFDGASGTDDTGSSAEIAVWLHLPVILVIDARGMARSVAAMARGYASMRPDMRLAGVICTRVASPNHEDLLRDAMASACPDIPLLGCLPVDDAVVRPARHLGLVTADDEPVSAEQRQALAAWVDAHVDVNRLIRLSGLPVVNGPSGHVEPPAPLPVTPARRPRIAVARDRAFCFVYPALLAALRAAGADAVFFSPLADARLPACDGVWIPGGYPEVHASALAANRGLCEELRAAVAAGLPAHGECGGYIWLMESLETAEGRFAMAGCLPGTVRIGVRRAALGYREVRLGADTPFGSEDATVRGHEFHYGSIVEGTADGAGVLPLWRISDRRGHDLGMEGRRLGSVSGSWVHVHPDSSPDFIPAFVAACSVSR